MDTQWLTPAYMCRARVKQSPTWSPLGLLGQSLHVLSHAVAPYSQCMMAVRNLMPCTMHANRKVYKLLHKVYPCNAEAIQSSEPATTRALCRATTPLLCLGGGHAALLQVSGMQSPQGGRHGQSMEGVAVHASCCTHQATTAITSHDIMIISAEIHHRAPVCDMPRFASDHTTKINKSQV